MSSGHSLQSAPALSWTSSIEQQFATTATGGSPGQEGVKTVTMTLIYGRPSALLPAFDSPAPQTGAHALVVGQSSVQGQVSIRTQRPKNQLGWAQTVPSTELGTTHTALTKNTAPTNNYKGTTSAKGAGMAKSLRISGGVPPRGRPV